jgi:hypothetical protein
MLIRAATSGDADAIWAIMEPIVRAGERIRCFADMKKEKVLSYWLSAERGRGAHVAICARLLLFRRPAAGLPAMCAHSLEPARERGFQVKRAQRAASLEPWIVRRGGLR